MMRGLFVGIDRYRSPVNRLTCAVADAQALGSLFEDSLDGQFKTLLDDEATRANILAELESLASASADDFVMMMFSGHGTDDHRLVPTDVDVADIPGSCVSLDELAERLDRIPATSCWLFSIVVSPADLVVRVSSRRPCRDRSRKVGRR